MSGLLTHVVRRQALMAVPRRHESALLIAGPPMNKVSKKVRPDDHFLNIQPRGVRFILGETLRFGSLLHRADALSHLHHVESTEVQRFQPHMEDEKDTGR